MKAMTLIGLFALSVLCWPALLVIVLVAIALFFYLLGSFASVVRKIGEGEAVDPPIVDYRRS